MSWFAQLPIYALPEMRAKNEALWRVVSEVFRDAGIADVPQRLDGIGERALFTQVCGYPLQTSERGRYALIGTPMYDVDGCTGPRHCAFIVVRRESTVEQPSDLRHTVFAVNDPLSNTGMNLPRRLFARYAGGGPFFDRIAFTGSHAESAQRVADGRADGASIDCVTYGFLADYHPELIARLRVVGRTDWSPAIPFVTADDGDLPRIDAMRGAMQRLANDPRYAAQLRALHIGGILGLADANYTMLRTYEQDAYAARYPVLC